jgi:excinuclease ABC subunit B
MAKSKRFLFLASKKKKIVASIQEGAEARKRARNMVLRETPSEVISETYLKSLEEEMLAAAENLEFERAAALRDKILRSKERLGQPVEEEQADEERIVGTKQRKRSNKSSSGRVPRRK